MLADLAYRLAVNAVACAIVIGYLWFIGWL